MELALAEARRGGYAVRPNPQVGAVIVKDGEILGKGHHEYFGGPHAEVNAFNRVNREVRGATMYVTLEPCSHNGKTPACTDIITADRFERVVVASNDPNADATGGGNILAERGITVDQGVLEDAAVEINKPFFTYHRQKRPYVILKYASTLDGFLAMPDGRSKWITGPEARRSVHELRAACQGIMVGWRTVAADNPDLGSHGTGKDPQVFIIDPELKIPGDVKVWEKNPVIFSNISSKGDNSISVLTSEQLDNIKVVLDEVYIRGIQTLLVEGGGGTLTAFLESGLYDEIHAYMAPKYLGQGIPVFNGAKDLNDWPIKLKSVDAMGKDVRMIYEKEN